MQMSHNCLYATTVHAV